MRREWWATATFFGCNGAVYGSIFSRLPEVIERYSMTPGMLGVVLVVPVFASLLGSAIGGRVVVRFGARRVARLSVVILALSLALMTVSPLLAGLVIALAVLGAADGVMDVAMNMHAVDLEIRIGRAVMQGLHAAWTAGALLAAVTAGLVAGSVPLVAHIAVAGAILGLIGVGLPSWWEPVRIAIPRQQGGSTRALGWIAAVAIAVSLAESVPLDWASVVLSEVFDATSAQAATATATTLAGMLAGRMVGDRIIGRVGARRTLVSFAMLTTVGALLVGIAPAAPLAYAALALAGMGASVMFPGMISIAGRISDDGVAAVTASARLGFMIGPLVTGLVAERFGFRPIMLLPALAAIAVASWAGRSSQVSGPARPSV